MVGFESVRIPNKCAKYDSLLAYWRVSGITTRVAGQSRKGPAATLLYILDGADGVYIVCVPSPGHRLTEHSIGSLEQLRAEVETARSKGWSMVSEELEGGLRGVAVPVRRGSEVVAAAAR